MGIVFLVSKIFLPIRTMRAKLAFFNKSVSKSVAFFLLVATCVACSFSKLYAQGNLLINPRRAVFEGQKKIMELNLANTGKDTARYVISLIEIRMNPDGSFEKIDQPDTGQNFASNYVRFFPRTVTLAPNEAQVVKVQVVKTDQLPAGEYRSHLYFRAVPQALPLGETDSHKDSSGISVLLTPIFGISIPVIVRVGESTAQVNLSDLSLQMAGDSTPTLNIGFKRTGNMSVYGDLKIDFVSPQGKVTQVGEVKGIAVYTPNLNRQFRMNLNKTSGIDYHSGKLHVVYSTLVNSKSLKIAEAELDL